MFYFVRYVSSVTEGGAIFCKWGRRRFVRRFVIRRRGGRPFVVRTSYIPGLKCEIWGTGQVRWDEKVDPDHGWR